MRTPHLFVDEPNLSVAWARAFLAVMERGVRGLAPLVVRITGFEDGEPQERQDIRTCLDETLALLGQHSCHTVTNTIFPVNLWRHSTDRHELYARYNALLPRLRRRSRENRHGLYFGRIIAFGRGPEDGNQIEHLIKNFEAGVRRPTAMVLNIFDPGRDHTRQRRRGFPCLNRIGLSVVGKGKLALKADYPAQFLLERAYGNYLGVCRLGKFLAGELNVELVQVTCTADLALLGDVPKRKLRALAAAVHDMLAGQAVAVNGESHANAG
jgi:hypothetical protein